MQTRDFRYPWWTRGDLDGFFGLMVDNLVQVLTIVFLCTAVCGLPPVLVYERILPGAAVSLLVGNLFYGWQARRVARRDRNPTCTALPYGINTPSLFAFALFVMRPVYESNRAALGDEAAGVLAWQVGLLACAASGVIELGCAFFAERLRRVTPRAALLGVLAAVGITFIASDFAFRIFAHPAIGLAPLAVLLLAYFARVRFPLGLPGGFVSLLIGAAAAWVLSSDCVASVLAPQPLMSGAAVAAAWSQVGWIGLHFCGSDLLAAVAQPELVLRFLTVAVPMGLLNVLGSLQNIESAEAGGDRFATAPSLAANGVGTLAAAAFGSCFPTTIYIGHPGWKALGARSGYSVANGLFFTVCFLAGLGPLLTALVPIEAGAPIVMYIGVLITAQAFQASPARHAPAVAIALFPAMAAMLVVNLQLALGDAGAVRGLGELTAAAERGAAAVAVLPGMVALCGANSSWFIVTLFWTAIAAALIDRHFRAASCWAATAAVLTAVGLLHACQLDAEDNLRELFIWQQPAAGGHFATRAWFIAGGYAVASVVFYLAAGFRTLDGETSAGAESVDQAGS